MNAPVMMAWHWGQGEKKIAKRFASNPIGRIRGDCHAPPGWVRRAA